MMMKFIPSILSLFLCLVIFFLPYDPLSNRLALIATIVVGNVGLVIINHFVKKKTQSLLSPALFFLVNIAMWEDAFGNILYWYERWHWWDDLGHFVGVGVVAGVFSEVFQKISAKKQWHFTPFFRVLFPLSVAMLLASAYEISEMIGDVTIQTMRVTDRLDAPKDLAWDLMGGLTFFGIQAMIHGIKQRK